VVHDVAVVVDGDVAGVELGDLGGGQGAVEADALDDAEAVGEFFVEFVDLALPGGAGSGKARPRSA
jgi:hypothetical protein